MAFNYKKLYLKGQTLRQEYPLCCIELVVKGLLPLLGGKCDSKSQESVCDASPYLNQKHVLLINIQY